MHHSSAHRPPRWKAQTSAPQLLRAQAHAAQLLRAPRRVVGQQAEREDADAPQHLRATRHHAPRGARALHRRPLHQLRAVLLRAAQRAEAALHLQLRIRLVPLPAVDQARRAQHPHHCPGKQIPQLSSASEVVRGHCREEQSGRELSRASPARLPDRAARLGQHTRSDSCRCALVSCRDTHTTTPGTTPALQGAPHRRREPDCARTRVPTRPPRWLR